MILRYVMIILICIFYIEDVYAKRLALVIGNADYKYDSLSNPVNDAIDFSEALKKCGFDVVLKINVSKNEILDLANSLKKNVSSKDVVLFYYAGHAVQINGKNKLITIESEAVDDVNIDDFSVDVQDIVDSIINAEMKIVVLDACRNNPFHDYYVDKESKILTRNFKNTSTGHLDRGLADNKAPMGTFIAYATASGSVAFDGGGRNGIYTKHILSNILKPGLKLEDVFKLVRLGVYEETNGEQLPWDKSSILGVFYFIKK